HETGRSKLSCRFGGSSKSWAGRPATSTQALAAQLIGDRTIAGSGGDNKVRTWGTCRLANRWAGPCGRLVSACPTPRRSHLAEGVALLLGTSDDEEGDRAWAAVRAGQWRGALSLSAWFLPPRPPLWICRRCRSRVRHLVRFVRRCGRTTGRRSSGTTGR